MLLMVASPIGRVVYRHCERKRSNPSRGKEGMDCFVASLLAMTEATLSRLPHGVVDQRLAERPDRAGDLVTGGDDVVERLFDPVAVFLCDHERRQQLDGMAAVAGDLGEDLVILE